MKIKLDFVTNSSSTAFYFVHKIEPNLIDAIKNHKKLFDLYHDEFNSCTHDDIIKILKTVMSTKKLRKEMVCTINQQIKYFKTGIEDDKKWLKNHEEKYGTTDTYMQNYISDLEYKITRLKNAQIDGFTHVAIISFGDNHGYICGPGIGTTMDYEGRTIDLTAEDLIIFTEQER